MRPGNEAYIVLNRKYRGSVGVRMPGGYRLISVACHILRANPEKPGGVFAYIVKLDDTTLR